MKPLSSNARELLLEYRREQKLPTALRASVLQSVELALQQGALPELVSRTGAEACAVRPAPTNVPAAVPANSWLLLKPLGLAGALLIAAGSALFATRMVQQPHAQREEAQPTRLLPPVAAQSQPAEDVPSEAVQRANTPVLPAAMSEPTRRVRRAKATASQAKSEARAQEKSPRLQARDTPSHAEPTVVQNRDESTAREAAARTEAREPATRIQATSHVAEEREPLFDDEVMLLRDANEHLRRAQPLRTLSTLAEHARRFPRGQLAELRVAVRIQALCALGKAQQAAHEAAGFLRAHPSSAYAPRVRSGCSQTGASEHQP